jgi:hypothetical protein
MRLKIPLEAFPLREGWTYQDGITARMTYRNGKLIVQRYTEYWAKVDEADRVSSSAVFKVDSSFTDLTSVQVMSRLGKFWAEF